MGLIDGTTKSACIVLSARRGVNESLAYSSLLTVLCEELKQSNFKLILILDETVRRVDVDGVDCHQIVSLKDILQDKKFAKGVWGSASKTYCVYEYLKGDNFDHVFFFGPGGLGFYPINAKLAGLYFTNTQFHIVCCGLVSQDYQERGWGKASLLLLSQVFQEKECVRLADSIIADKHCLDWVGSDRGFSLVNKKSEFLLPHVFGRPFQEFYSANEDKKTAVLILNDAPLCDLRAFLSSFSNRLLAANFSKLRRLIISCDNGQRNSIERGLARLVLSYDLRIDYEGAIELDSHFDKHVFYLIGAKRYNYHILREIADRGHSVCGFDQLAESNKKGSYEFEFYDQHDFLDVGEQVRRVFESVLEHSEESLDVSADPDQEDNIPLVSVCVVHHERPKYLSRVLSALEAQDYSNFEVIVVDDGSHSSETQSAFGFIAKQYSSDRWRFYSKENGWLGAARNYAADRSMGKYLIFVDDDNIPGKSMVLDFTKAIHQSGCDAMTCFAGLFEEDVFQEYPDNIPYCDRDFLPLGSAAALGGFINMHGDASCIVSREAFDLVGGFWEYYGLPKEDHEFFMRLIGRGFKLGIAPKRLFYYRKSSSGMMQSSLSSGGEYFESKKLVLESATKAFSTQISPVEKQIVLELATPQAHANTIPNSGDDASKLFKKLLKSGFDKLLARFRKK